VVGEIVVVIVVRKKANLSYGPDFGITCANRVRNHAWVWSVALAKSLAHRHRCLFVGSNVLDIQGKLLRTAHHFANRWLAYEDGRKPQPVRGNGCASLL
jgi:hypothetical protein